MQENKDTEKSILELIENIYLIQLIKGRETSKGSFWATDESGNEFYICGGLVKENKEQIQDLKCSKSRYWALVQDVVWNGKWNGMAVRAIMMIASEKTKCELFKETLKERWQFIIERTKKIDDAIDLVSTDPFNKIYEQLLLESEQLSEKSRDKEMELGIICRGWQDID
jgi:hypothetical protein